MDVTQDLVRDLRIPVGDEARGKAQGDIGARAFLPTGNKIGMRHAAVSCTRCRYDVT